MSFYWLSIPIGLIVILGALLALTLLVLLGKWIVDTGLVLLLFIPIFICIVVIIGYAVSGQEPPIWTVLTIIASFIMIGFSFVAADYLEA